MTAVLDLFDSITYFYDSETLPPGTPHVILADDGTKHLIKGYGTILYKLCGKNVWQFCYYIPALGNTILISICQHSQYQGNYFHSENNQAIVTFPEFTVSLSNRVEIGAIVTKLQVSSIIHYGERNSILSNTKLTTTSTLISTSKLPFIPKHKRVKFSETVQFVPLTKDAVLPTRATKGSIGYNVCSSQSLQLEPNSITKIKTGITVALPSNRDAPRSSLAAKGISVEGGCH